MLTRASNHYSAPQRPANGDTAVAALRAKLAETEVRRARLLSELAVLDQEMATLDHAATLLAGRTNGYVDAYLSNKQIADLLGLGRGMLGKEVMEILLSARRPMTAQQLSQKILGDRHISLGSAALTRLCLLIVKNLRRREARGLVQTLGRTDNNALLWVAVG